MKTFILAGSLALILGLGPLPTLAQPKAGDVVVQQATNHAWVNRGNEVCRVAFVLIDGREP